MLPNVDHLTTLAAITAASVNIDWSWQPPDYRLPPATLPWSVGLNESENWQERIRQAQAAAEERQRRRQREQERSQQEVMEALRRVLGRPRPVETPTTPASKRVKAKPAPAAPAIEPAPPAESVEPARRRFRPLCPDTEVEAADPFEAGLL